MNCPVTGDEHNSERCPHCGAGLQISIVNNKISQPRKLFDRCPYDNAGLVVKHGFGHSAMAHYVCTTPNCLFAIVQGWDGN